MLFLREEDVRRLLPMREAIRLVREAFLGLAAGTSHNQPRRRLWLAGGAVLHSMAGAHGKYFGTKVYSTHPVHGAHFLFWLCDAATARPLALFEANWLGQIRTGAATGLATDLLATPHAATLGIIGSGFQARSQLAAVLQVRPIRRVRVWSRDRLKREEFAQNCEREHGVRVEAVDSAEQALCEAAIVITATSARDPVLEASWIGPGVHLNAIGSNHPKHRELPDKLIWRADLIAVDSLEQARIESGDLLLAVPPGEWNRLPIVELASVAAKQAGRTAPSQVTLFKSNGLGVEDVAVAGYVYERALETGAGRRSEFLYS